uniref:Uncharacterized protein n=1 Tax=Anguilla anguilla TaxID=7936 RepID=A0A0E9PGK1_ANGAN
MCPLLICAQSTVYNALQRREEKCKILSSLSVC